MVLGQDGQQPVSAQGDGLKILPGGQPQKSAVHPALGDPVFNFRVVPQQELVVDAGVILLKGFDDIRHPVDGAAGKGANADDAGLDPVEVIHLHLQLLILAAQALGIGQHSGAIGGQTDPGTAPLQKGDIPLLFQIVDHPAHTGLGVIEGLRRPGKAAVFHRLEKGHIFEDVHIHGLCPLFHAKTA